MISKLATMTLLFALGLGPAPSFRSADANDAPLLYSTHCADCHEADGKGTEYRGSGISIPDFASKAWMTPQSPTELRLSILLGKGTEMPPFGDEMSKSEAQALVAYIQTFAGVKAGSPETVTMMMSSERKGFDREWQRLRAEWQRVFSELDARETRSTVKGSR